ncbi:MAG: hypothetical protein AAGA96_17870 [Verrucomicrobiota bacterium]
MEIVLALGIAAGVLTGVFMIANGSLSLADTIITEGRADNRREAFLNFLERNFESLPGNAEIELVTQDTSSRYLPTLTIENAPSSFAFAGQPISAQAIVLRTQTIPSGGINVVLDYYEEPLLDVNANSTQLRPEPVGSIILYRDIWRFELRALDSRQMEWLSDWDIRGRLPIQFELNAVFDRQGEEVVHYFWIPRKANPASMMQALGQGTTQNTSSPETSTDPNNSAGGNRPSNQSSQ